MQKRSFCALMLGAVITTLCLCGCSRFTGPATTEFSDGQVVEETVRSVTMTLAPGETSKLDELPELISADLRGSEAYEEIYAWTQAHPNVVVRYTVPLPNGSAVTNEISALNMSELESSGVEQLISAVSCLPNVHSIELGSTRDNFTWEDVNAIVTAFPDITIKYTGDVYGKTVKLSDTTLDLKFIPVEDGGALVRRVIPCLKDLELLDMDSCGLSNQEMAAIRDEFPDVKVVWRVWFGSSYSVRTDVEKILASKPSVGGALERGNCESLMYCTEVKYLDIGHNETLDYFDFLSYMPKLEVCVLAMTQLRDLTPLTNCPNMEYLEIQTNPLLDLSPLENLTNLKHLNICHLLEGRVDLAPLFGLTKLERLWIGGWTGVDRAQVEELQAALPNCEINTSANDPTEGRWRFVDLNLITWQYIPHPRYQELQYQFGYQDKDYAFYWNDPIYAEHAVEN